MSGVDLSIVVPCYNEAAGLGAFWERLTGAVAPLGLAWEAIFVNDGRKSNCNFILFLIEGLVVGYLGTNS